MWKWYQKTKCNTFQFMKRELKGFTLIESMLALLILSLVLLIANAVVKSSVSTGTESGRNCQVEWHLFINQLEHISKKWKIQTVQPKKLVFLEGKTQFELSSYKNQLRIKKNGGYEPVLTRVVKTKFSTSERGVEFKIIMDDGNEYCATFYEWKD